MYSDSSSPDFSMDDCSYYSPYESYDEESGGYLREMGCYDSFESNPEYLNRKFKNNNSRGIISSLLDLSAKVVSRCYSYKYIEQFYTTVPEPIAKKIMLWSFPRGPEDLIRYLGYCNKESNRFEDVIQIGFQITGKYVWANKTYDVSIYIDRCVITSASCTCDEKHEYRSYCSHIVGLAFYRLLNADTIPVHLPISDALYPLNREQLLHIVKNIINKHSNLLLQRAQAITSELLDENSEKNILRGAPDPTAGRDTDGDPEWIMNHNKPDLIL